MLRGVTDVTNCEWTRKIQGEPGTLWARQIHGHAELSTAEQRSGTHRIFLFNAFDKPECSFGEIKGSHEGLLRMKQHEC